MKQKELRTTMITLSALLVLLLLFGFQNCAPVMPLDGIVDASSLSVRKTATPSGTPVPLAGSGGTYSGSIYDGTCSNDTNTQPMAVNGTDVAGGALIGFTSTDGRAAFWNIANGALARGSVCSMIGSGWVLQAIADVNGDLNPDVIWRNANGNVVVWLMRGSSRVSTALIGTIGSNWQLEGAADFNLDGKADLVWRDLDGNVKIWLMNGTSAPTETAAFAMPLSSHILGTTDFDGDRRADLFWKNDSGSISLTTFDASLNPTTTAFPSGIYTGYTILGFGDFNGDLKTDLLVTRNSDGLLFLRYMNGTALGADSTPYAAPNAAWNFQFTRDLNGDTTADWVWVITNANGSFLAYTPIAVTPGSTTSFPTPIQPGFSVFKYPHR